MRSNESRRDSFAQVDAGFGAASVVRRARPTLSRLQTDSPSFSRLTWGFVQLRHRRATLVQRQPQATSTRSSTAAGTSRSSRSHCT
jgi:hypothetical protein